MGTSVIYNDCWLNNVVTRSFAQEVVYDPSGADMWYSRYRLEFDGLAHWEFPAGAEKGPFEDPNRPWIHPRGVEHQDAIGVWQEVQAQLMVPRRELYVKSGARTMFQALPWGREPANDRDVANGPRPLRCELLRMVSNRCFWMRFTVECAKLDCQRSHDGDRPVVLSNRWSLSSDMDADFYATQTIRGKLRIVESAKGEQAPTLYKGLCLPPLEAGFRRERISFTQSADGLEADYEVTDRQVHLAAPWPCTTIGGSHTVSSDNGFIWKAECRVRVTAPPDAPKRLVVARAVEACTGRLNLLAQDRQPMKNWLPEAIVITDEFGVENACTCFIKIMETSADASQETAEDQVRYVLGTAKNSLGADWTFDPLDNQPEPYSDVKSRVPQAWGYVTRGDGVGRGPAVELALSCLLQQPCDGRQQRTVGRDAAQLHDYSAERNYPQVTVSTARTLPERLKSPETILSASAKESVYTYCRMTTRYLTDTLRVVCPVTAAASPSDRATVVVAALSQPVCHRVIEADVERIGDWPLVPDAPDTYSDGQGSAAITATILHRDLEPLPAGITPDASRQSYRVRCRYVYALSRPPTANEKLRLGALPVLKFKPTDAVSLFDQKKYLSSEVGP